MSHTRREEAIDEVRDALDSLCTAWNTLDGEVVGDYSERRKIQAQLALLVKQTDALLTEMKKPRRVA